MTSPTPSLWQKAMPLVFVLLWSTGFVGAKYGLPYAPPLTFLAIRFALVAALLLGWVLLRGGPWPPRRQWRHLVVAGLLLQAIYLAGVYLALSWGVEAGTSALIVSVQPLLVAALAGPWLGERVTPRQWLGLALGLAGVGLVVARKAGLDAGLLGGAAACLVSLLSITAGVLYQKRYLGSMPLAGGNALQFTLSALVVGIAALALEDGPVLWTWPLLISLAWMTVVLSLGAMALLLIQIRRGAASRVSSLFFLVPPTAALMAWPMFGETLHGLEWAGMALVVLGVALVNLRRT